MKKIIKICLMLFMLSASLYAYEADEKKPSFSINGEVQNCPEESFRDLVLAKDLDRLDQIKSKDSSILTTYFDDYLVNALTEKYEAHIISDRDKAELMTILQYFYRNKIDFPQTLNLKTYEKIQELVPELKDIKLVKDDFETDKEFEARKDAATKENTEIINWITSSKYIDITYDCFSLSYGEYHIEDGYYDCSLHFQENNHFFDSIEVLLLEKCHFRFYVDRKAAKTIRDTNAESFNYPKLQKFLITPRGDGKFEIADLQFGINVRHDMDDSDTPTQAASVPDNLYAFMIRQYSDEAGETTLIIQNFHAQNKLFLSGKELTDNNTTFKIPADGEYNLSRNPDGSGVLWHATLLKSYKIGVKGPCGGIVFYDKGSYSDGWRYLEAAPLLDAKELPGPYNGEPYLLSQKIGFGYINTIRDTYDNNVNKYGLTYKGGNLSEWFIPSLNEVKEMAKNRQILGGFLKGKQYWTSSKDQGVHTTYPRATVSINESAIAWPIRRF